MTAISSGGRFGGDLGSLPYVFIQTTPLAGWIINHNLGYYPDVRVYNLGLQLVSCDIQQTSIYQTRVSFTVPFTGSAYLI